MTLQPWKKMKDEVLASNRWWEYRKTTFLLPQGGSHDCYYPHFLQPGAMIIPVRHDGQILMLRQYRCIISRMDTTFPAGRVDEGETPQEAAARELREETGFGAKTLEKVGSFYASPGSTNSQGYVYLATELSEAPLPSDDQEEFEQFWTTPEEIDKMIADGTIMDAWALSAWVLGKDKVLEYIRSLKG